MLKIFLAEDEVIVRETIKRMIPWEDLGFELVGEAADGEMALPLLLRQKPDLLITDIKMPFMDGLTLAKVAKKEIPGLKVVILSGYDDFNYAKQAINIGAVMSMKRRRKNTTRSSTEKCRHMRRTAAGISLRHL